MRPQLICHSVYLMGSILAGTTIIRQANGRSTSVVATGGTLERGRMGKLLGTRPDHVRDGVANSNPEPSQMEEGYHPIFLLSPDFERQEKAAKGSKRSKKERAREKAGGPWGGPWPAWGGP